MPKRAYKKKKQDDDEEIDYEELLSDSSDDEQSKRMPMPKLPPVKTTKTVQVPKRMDPITSDDVMTPLVQFDKLQDRNQQAHHECRVITLPDGYLIMFVMEQEKDPADYKIQRSLGDKCVVEIKSDSSFSNEKMEEIFCHGTKEVTQTYPFLLEVSPNDGVFTAIKDQLKSFIGSERDETKPQTKMTINLPSAVKAEASPWKLVMYNGKYYSIAFCLIL